MIDKMLTSYATSAKRHIEASDTGNYRVANRAYDKLTLLRKQLLGSGAVGQAALLSLLCHAEPAVRVWAGAHCLPIEPGQAEQTLQELANTWGIIALTAETTLDEWRAGRLTFD